MKIDREAGERFFQQLHKFYIQPEIGRRKKQGTLPNDFQIQQCLILLPVKQSPIVKFNGEVGWHATPKLAPGITMEVGQDIYLHDIEKIEEVHPPQVNGERVAFVFIYWNGQTYDGLFDFTPNWPDFEPTSEFELGKAVLWLLQRKMIEQSIRISKDAQSQLKSIGLWPATSLLPYPISKIVVLINEGQPDAARRLLIEYCNNDFIEELVETWITISEFKERQDLFDEATFAHRLRKYHLSIYTLIPQIEGIIADWLYKNFSSDQVKFKVESRVKQWRDIISSTSSLPMAYHEALLSVSDFMLDDSSGPLQEFKNWLDNIDSSFPARHSVSHGKYFRDVFTEENSIKLFLLLDTICQFMMFYEYDEKKEK